MSEFASTDLKIVLDGLNFLNSSWIIYDVNVEIINCNAASLVLELQHLAHAIIQNCTIGYWTLIEVRNAFIKNCNIVFHEGVSTSLDFINSSAYMENMTMEHENITGEFNGIYVYNHSLLHIEQSKFVNNTVKRGIIKVMKSSSLTMSNCSVVGNYALENPGVVYGNESFVHLKNTHFNGNTAIYGGGAIFIENMSFLQMKNCTFKNNSVDGTTGVGGAILFLNNSLIDMSYSIFENNKAFQGGAIHQQNSSKMKLDQCSFFGNSEAAITSLYGSEIAIMNSFFANNSAEMSSGAVAMVEKCVLKVSYTTFKNNAQTSSTLYLFDIDIDLVGGGAIYLSESVGNISKSTFENNVAGKYGGAIYSENSSLNIEYSTFQNNSVLNKEIGEGGGLLLQGNSTIKISNVLLSECHARYGGAIMSNSTTVIMSNSSLIANTGSAIALLEGNTLEIDNCTFLNNWTPESGGAILCRGSNVVKVVNTKFSKNRAVKSGGAVMTSSIMSNHTAHNCSFTDNSAITGGAIYVFYSVFNIVDSNFSHNVATTGGVALLLGNLIMKNCRINNNTVPGNAGVILASHGTLQMSNCLVYNNTANIDSGVVYSTNSQIVITTSVFKMNRALAGKGGVFSIRGGTILLRNSRFVKNSAKVIGGMLYADQKAVINIIKSFCFGNQAKYTSGLLFCQNHTTIRIIDTKISHNSAVKFGAMCIDYNSMLELNGSLVEGNYAEAFYGALIIGNNSLLVAFNSSFKGNKATIDSSILINNSTVYLEKCTFLENRLTYGGTISTETGTMLKVSNTVFIQNEGYDIFYFTQNKHFATKFESYKSLFMHGNISLKSNVKNFVEVAVYEKVIGEWSHLSQSFFIPGETPYASSKMFHILNVFRI